MHGKLQPVTGIQQGLGGFGAAVGGVFAQQLHHGLQGLVVAGAAVVAQALAAQAGHDLVQVLQHGVNHGLGVELEGAARLKVHPLQRAVEVGNALADLGHLGIYAAQQGAHALVRRVVEVFLKPCPFGGQVFFFQHAQALQVVRQGFHFLCLLGQCAPVFFLGAAHLADDVFVQFGLLFGEGLHLLIGLGQ